MKEEIAYIVVTLDVRAITYEEYEGNPEILGVYINDPDAAEKRMSEYNRNLSSREPAKVIQSAVYRRPSARQQWKLQRNS